MTAQTSSCVTNYPTFCQHFEHLKTRGALGASGFLRSAAVHSLGRDVFCRDAAQRCGVDDKNDPLFGGLSSLHLEQGTEVCSNSSIRRTTPGACVSGVPRAHRARGASSLGPAPPFGSPGGMLSFFPPECAKYSRSGYLGEHLRSMLRRLSCCRFAKAQVVHCGCRVNEGRRPFNLPRTGIFCAFASVFRQDDHESVLPE